MDRQTNANLDPVQFVAVLATHPRRLLVPAVAVTVLVGLYALVRPATWEASQALMIRNEAAANADSPGKFSHADEMKTLQETILELSRSRGVLSAALKDAGPPAGCRQSSQSWPTAEDVAGLRDRVTLSPPKGAEFGSTEIFYLKVRDRDRGRAIALAAAVAARLETSFQQFRDAKAQSIIRELSKAVNLSAEDLKESTERLAEIETQTGSDLAELRILHDASSGESSLRRTITEVQNELRQAKAECSANEELLALLGDADKDPSVLLGAPSRLLDAQPAIRKLRDGLVDAQLNAANLQGRMSAAHPLVVAALESERQIRADLQKELGTVIRGIEAELRLNRDRLGLLEEQLAQTALRLASLAKLRASYSNQVAENANRTELLQRAEQKLSEARATQATANAASLLARIDVPDCGTNPLGPGRATLVLAGMAAGLLTGLGVVFLTVSPVQAAPPTKAAPVAADPVVVVNGRTKAYSATNGHLSLNQALLALTPSSHACR
ncbi:MAG: hypothetical protein HUU20_05455 [Pirellulales bacterium]|nr:hypothetical protein [Pirellulales bacterium]